MKAYPKPASDSKRSVAPSLSATDISDEPSLDMLTVNTGHDIPIPIPILKMLTVFAFGGTEKQVVNLVTRLDRSRFNLEMGCLMKWGQFLGEVEQQKIPVTEFKIKSLYKLETIIQQFKFSAYLRRRKIQIVHSYNFYANVFAIPAAKLAGVPVKIASIRDRGVYLTPAKKVVQRYVCGLADCILVNAESIRDWLIEDGYQADKITLIRNGIDLSKYGNRPLTSDLQREFGFPASARLVMMVSRLDPQKGVEDLLQAAVAVIQDCPDARFLIVGERLHSDNNINRTAGVRFIQKLEQLVINLGLDKHVKFTGYRSDVPELIAQATVSVLPSYSEGLSNSVLEAMASGIPVVATRVGGNPELVKHEQCGLLVSPHAPDELAKAIITLLQNPALASSYGMNARQRVQEHFSLERMVQDTQNLYMKLLAQRKR